MARCNDCNKFASYNDPPECDTETVEIVADSVRAEVSVRLECAECGSELKTATVEGEANINHKCGTGGVSDPDYEEGDEQYELLDDVPDAEGTSRQTDRKTYYGFELTAQVHCRKCRDEFSVHVEGEEQASSFDEC